MINMSEIETELLWLTENQELIKKDLAGLNVERLPWTKSDLITAVVSGAIGIAIDLLSKKSIGEASAEKLVKPFREFDLKNNPIDKHLPGASPGEHRVFSQGHDIFRFYETVKVMMEGKALSYHTSGGLMEVKAVSDFPNLSLEQAAIILSIHLLKDVFTSRSLPMPGTSLLADLNNGKVPDFLVKGARTNDLNLKNGTGAVMATMIPILFARVYTSMMYENVEDELVKQKRLEIESLSQFMIVAASSANAGLSKNPLKINYSSLLRLCLNGIQLANEQSKRSNNSRLRAELQLTSLHFEQRRTQLALQVMHYCLDESDDAVGKSRRA